MTFRAISPMQEINITPRRWSTETRHPPRNATLKRLACSATYELSSMSPVNCVAVELQFPWVAWLIAISRVKLCLVMSWKFQVHCSLQFLWCVWSARLVYPTHPTKNIRSVIKKTTKFIHIFTVTILQHRSSSILQYKGFTWVTKCDNMTSSWTFRPRKH
jgi:hypothetical protein